MEINFKSFKSITGRKNQPEVHVNQNLGTEDKK